MRDGDKRMSWARLLSTKRLGAPGAATTSEPDGGRTPFDSDIDRVTFSGAFRRLGRKTQVHPLEPNDHVHTRLTHSLEVGQVGRALGKRLAQNSPIREELPENTTPGDVAALLRAACLAHDIGNPPFGHAGEKAMSQWFKFNGADLFGSLSADYARDLSSCEGNAQGFRMLAQTENHVFEGGLRLTYGTLGSFLKYPWTSTEPSGKFSVYLSERGILETVAQELGLPKQGNFRWARHPLAYLVEAADDICYAIIDLEDAVELEILPFEQVKDLLLSPFDENKKKEIESSFKPGAHRVNLARARGPVFDKLVSSAIAGFMASYEPIMRGDGPQTVWSSLPEADQSRRLVEMAKTLAAENVFPARKKVEIELGSYGTFDCLLRPFCRAALDKEQNLRSPSSTTLTWKSHLLLKLLGDHAPGACNPPASSTWDVYQCLRRVIDFVTGMTDNYAVYLARQIQGTTIERGQRR